MGLYKRQWPWCGKDLRLGPVTAVCGHDLAGSLRDLMHINEHGIKGDAPTVPVQVSTSISVSVSESVGVNIA